MIKSSISMLTQKCPSTRANTYKHNKNNNKISISFVPQTNDNPEL